MAGVNPTLGGRPGLTKFLNTAYKRYTVDQQSQGLQPLDWGMWLGENGFKLDPDRLVSPLPNTDIDAMIQRMNY